MGDLPIPWPLLDAACIGAPGLTQAKGLSIAHFLLSNAELSYIALGSNLGDSIDHLRRGAQALQSLFDTPIRLSSPWLTTPVDCPPGAPCFINAMAEVALPPRCSPRHLLTQCQTIEKALGRPPKKIQNEARPLDLDLISVGRQELHTPDLILPHPRAHQRFFVLAPLNELAPALVLPGHESTVSEYLLQVPEDPSARPLRGFAWKP